MEKLKLSLFLLLLFYCVSALAAQVPEKSEEKKRVGVLFRNSMEINDSQRNSITMRIENALYANYTVITRTKMTMELLDAEKKLQEDPHMNRDTAFGAISELGIDYAVVLELRQLGNHKFVIFSMINLTTFEQVGGSYRVYEKPADISNVALEMVEEMTTQLRNVKNNPLKLGVPLLQIDTALSVSETDNETFMIILAIEMLKSKYAVLPRDRNRIYLIEKAQEDEHTSEQNDPTTVPETRMGENPDFLLAINITKFEGNIEIAGQILKLDGNVHETIPNTRIKYSKNILDTMPWINKDLIGQEPSLGFQQYKEFVLSKESAEAAAANEADAAVNEANRLAAQAADAAAAAANKAKTAARAAKTAITVNAKNAAADRAEAEAAMAANFSKKAIEAAPNSEATASAKKSTSEASEAAKIARNEANAEAEKIRKWQNKIFHLGFRAGLPLYWYKLADDIKDPEIKNNGMFNFTDIAGYTAALQASVQFNPILTLQAETIFVRDSLQYSGTEQFPYVENGEAKFKERAYDASFNSWALMIPLLIKLSSRPNIFMLSIFGGPHVTVPLGEMEYKSSLYGDTEFDFAIPFGITGGMEAGIKLGSRGTLFVDARYAGDIGNTSIANAFGTETLQVYRGHRVFFTIGYEWGLVDHIR
jgi:hypothetical protein